MSPAPILAEPSALLSLPDACGRAAAWMRGVEADEIVPLALAAGRALAEDVVAVRACPSFDQSAMDGYAVSTGGGLRAGARLHRGGRIAAGQEGQPLPAATAARIFTGAPIPPGADGVVMQEHVRADGETVEITRGVRPGENIRRRGEDVAPGDRLAAAGDRLDIRHVALLAAQGLGAVRVRRRLRVGVLSTGNEVLAAGQGAATGALIYDSNRPMLLGLIAGAGLTAIDGGQVPDDPARLSNTLRELAATCDLIISTGGVSVGEEDHTARALSGAGGHGESLKIALKPGKPAVVGRIGDAAYLGLPGNPVSALVSWSLLGRAMLAAAEGRAFAPPAGLPLALADAFERKPGRTEFVPARLVPAEGEMRLRLLPGTSARLRPLVEADGFAQIPADMAEAAPGERLAFHPFERFLMP